MSEVVRTFASTEVGQEGPDATAKAPLPPLVRLAQTCLQLAEGHPHRIEVRRGIPAGSAGPARSLTAFLAPI